MLWRGSSRRTRIVRATTVVGLAGVVTFAPAAATGAAAADPQTSAAIRDAISRLRASGELRIGEVTLASFDVLQRVYEMRNYTPLWVDAAGVRHMLGAIAASYEEGLDPDDYHAAALRQWVGERGDTLPADPSTRAAVDLTLTDALIRLGRHLRHGKVDPVSVDAAWEFLDSARGSTEVDAAQWAVSVVERGEIAELLTRTRPAIEGYDALQRELARLRRLEQEGGWLPVPAGPTLRPGDRHPRVLALRARLSAGGDLAEGDTAADAAMYDGVLVEAVRRFQHAHGLDADGVTGARTLAALGKSPRHWIDQIRVNLERARWVRSGFANALVVDIAGFDARYVSDGELLWQARVQVGNKYRSTPVLSSKIRSIVLNPTWTVPPTILAEDILPEAARDPLYVGRRGLEVIDRGGQQVEPTAVDWGSFTAGTLPFTLRQGPGPGNPLGRIKFLFPNPHFVYLHDTPSRSLFSRADRAASSGCIRIEQPLELAELLLQQKKGWTRERLDAAIASGRTQTLFLDEPVPIYLLYWTVGVMEDGSILFKRDVYDRDPPVLAALDSRLVAEHMKQLTRQMP